MQGELRSVRVVTAYKAAYHGELRLREGDKVGVGDGDDHWPAFRWCLSEAGWLPAENTASGEDAETGEVRPQAHGTTTRPR
jgi:hypothetical protein